MNTSFITSVFLVKYEVKCPGRKWGWVGDVSSLGRKKRICATRESQHSHEEVENAHLKVSGQLMRSLNDAEEFKQCPYFSKNIRKGKIGDDGLKETH